jgi:eukaryotic-like serine/threonine-protein kinase
LIQGSPSELANALRDRYKIERELGRGGMATVYLAHDLRHDRDVALKVLRPELAAVLGRERFLTEIRLTAKLDHPHILTLIDSGESNGFLWYVIPYVRGESLRDRLNRIKQLSVDEAMSIIKQIGGALDYAHQRGIIHRDIKPENILFHEGEAMLADFGIALAVKEAGGNRVTETGLSLGTPQYMSPEQATGERQLDARTDLYSLGAVLYEMLGGEPPHSGATAQAVIAKLMTERPTRLRVLRETIPESVEAAVAKALAKVPADRFARAVDLVAAVERAEPRRRLRPTRRIIIAAAVIVAALLVGLAAWLVRPTSAGGPMVTRQLTFTGDACCPALSPDGNWAAFGRQDSLLVQEVSGSRPVFVARANLIGDLPRWSPDGSRILYTARDSQGLWLWTVPRLGGDPHRVTKAGFPWFNFGPDGRQVVYSRGLTDSVFIVDVGSGEVVRRLSLAPRSYMAWRARFSPNGRWIAFGGAKNGIPFLAVVSPDGSTMHRLVDWVDRGTVEWSPRGDALYFFQRVPGGADLMKVRLDPETGERQGGPVRVMSHTPFGEFSVAADGRTVLFQRDVRSSHVWTFSITGQPGRAIVRAKPLTSGTANFGNPAISPDGRWVVYAQDEGRERNLYVVPYEGGAPRLVGPTRSDRVTPRWAPDNQRLAFASADSSAGGILVADMREPRFSMRGRSALRLFFGGLAWSPDGRTLLFPPDEPDRFVLLDLETNRETRIAPPVSRGMLHNPQLSPDGREVLLAASDGFSRVLLRVELAAKRWQEFAAAPADALPLLWAPDGWIYLLRGRELWRIRSDGGDARLYASLPQECVWWEQPTMDDRATRLVCAVREIQSDIWAGTNFDAEQ